MKNILGFFGTKQNYGNDKYGEEWIKEQQKRQDYHIIKGKRKNYIQPENHSENQLIYFEPSPAEKKLK